MTEPMIQSHKADLDDLLYGRTVEARLINKVTRSATAEGKLANLTVHKPEDGWHKVEFYWKPLNVTPVEVKE